MQCVGVNCDREATRVGAQMCEAHYYRQRRGRQSSAAIRGRNEARRCEVADCDKPTPKGFLCPMHQARKGRHGDVNVRLKAPVVRGPAHPSWKEVVPYHTLHQRLRDTRGKASYCEQCGVADERTYHWALDHTTKATVLQGVEGPYSLDLNAYISLCVPCHKRMDLARAL